jgi:hypothetical protein
MQKSSSVYPRWTNLDFRRNPSSITSCGICFAHALSSSWVAAASPTSPASLAQALARHPVACFTTGRQSELGCLTTGISVISGMNERSSDNLPNVGVMSRIYSRTAPGLQQAAARAFDDILKKDSTLDKQLADILHN